MRSIFLVILACFVLSSCESCPGRGEAAPSKEAYIQSLDAQCSEMMAQIKIEEKEMKELFARDPHAAIAYMEKFFQKWKPQNKEIENRKRPVQDAALLQTFWDEFHKFDALEIQMINLMKELVARSDKLGDATADHHTSVNDHEKLLNDVQESQLKMQKLVEQIGELNKKVSGLAQQYGFKVCSISEQGFSGELIH